MRRINKVALTLFVILLLLPLGAGAANVYVDADCGNITAYVPATKACTGGSDRSYTTVQGAVSYVSAGDTIHVRAGTYSENVSLNSANKGTDWTTGAITIQKYSGDVTPVINGGTGIAFKCEVAGSWYWIIDGLKFTRTDINDTDTLYIGVYPTAGNRFFKVQNCAIDGKFRSYQAGDITVDTCAFDGRSKEGNVAIEFQPMDYGGPNYIIDNTVQNYSERGIWVNEGDYSEILRNTVTNCGFCINIDNYGRPTQSLGNKVNNNIVSLCGTAGATGGIEFENAKDSEIKGNLVYDSQWGIFVLDYAAYAGGDSNNLIANNIVYNTDQAGIRVDSAVGTHVYNNTVYNNTGVTAGYWAGISLTASYHAPESVDIRNNIVYQPSVNDACLWLPAAGIPTGLVLDYNLYYNASQTDVIYNGANSTWYTLAEWQAATTYDDNSIQDNPDFTNLVTYDFTLQSDSPAKDCGNGTNNCAIAAVTTDYAGTARPQGAGYDIGAMEYGATTLIGGTLSGGSLR